MSLTLTIHATGPASAVMDVNGEGDLDQARRILLECVVSVEQTKLVNCRDVPRAKLELLRGFLANVGASDKGSARRLLLMALLQLEDEDDEVRFVVPNPVLPVIAPKG